MEGLGNAWYRGAWCKIHKEPTKNAYKKGSTESKLGLTVAMLVFCLSCYSHLISSSPRRGHSLQMRSPRGLQK